MIERINACVQGKVGKCDIDLIKNHIVDMIENNYSKTLDCKCNPSGAYSNSHYTRYLMFGEHYICVNSKNIEFQDSFHYENFRPISEHMEKLLNKGLVKDFLIQFWVYRLGQYSYFAAEVTPLFEDVNLDSVSA